MDFRPSEELCFSELDEMLTVIQEVIDEDKDYIQPNLEIEKKDNILNHDSHVGPKEFTQEDVFVHQVDTLYACTVCREFFKSANHLKKHMDRSHPWIFVQNGYLYKCFRSCNRSFQNNVANLFACQLCGKLLRTERTWTLFMLCEICGKGFSHAGSLKTHSLIHEKEKPHICDLCSKQFRQKAHLNAHLLSSHSDKKPHKCHVCQKNLSHKGNLTQHLKTHSSEDMSCRCKSCNKSFLYKSQENI